MTKSICFWVESKRDNSIKDEYILSRLVRFFTVILEEKDTLQKIMHPSRGEIISYRINIKDVKGFNYIIKIYSLVLDFFYNSILKHDSLYAKFIRNVPIQVRKRKPQNHKNWAVIKIKIEPIDELNRLFDTYNQVYPKLFVHMYFEEIVDGYIGFFQEEFDLDAVFRDPNNLRSGEIWLEQNGFLLPNWYIKERTIWLFSNLKNGE